MRVNQAILHSYDAKSCVKVFSEAPMDLSVDAVKSYVTSLARRAQGNLDARRGEFLPDSAFAQEVRAFFRGQVDFARFTAGAAEFLMGELSKMDETPSFDLLFVEFEGHQEKTVNERDDEEVEMMFDAQAPRYLALVMLESRRAYMHEVGRDELGHTLASIARHHAILPNPGQKVRTFAVISATGDIRFCDEPRVIAGEGVMVLPDALLRCTSEASTKEVVETVCDLVGEVAEEYGSNPAKALAAAKAYVAESAQDDDVLVPEQLAREVFADTPQIHDRFVEEAESRELPDRVRVEPDVAKRVASKHHIRTDTGVDVTFPAEYGKNPEFLEFESNPDGTLSIRIKNVGSIENR